MKVYCVILLIGWPIFSFTMNITTKTSDSQYLQFQRYGCMHDIFACERLLSKAWKLFLFGEKGAIFSCHVSICSVHFSFFQSVRVGVRSLLPKRGRRALFVLSISCI